MAKIYEKKEIQVYDHWQGLEDPARMVTMTVTHEKGREIFCLNILLIC